MIRPFVSMLIVGSALVLVMPVATPVNAAELPDATRAMLKKLKFDASILKGLDKELKTPASWAKDAVKEPPVRILGTWDANQFDVLVGPFNERYPKVKVRYTRAGRYDRTIKTLIAFKNGRLIADILLSAGRTINDFKALDGLMDLRVLPTFTSTAPRMSAADGSWVGSRLAYRCMGYNTKKVKPEELPKTWDDLLSDPRWRKGRFALSNSPNSWIVGLWGVKGEKWARAYMTKLLTVVKPQLRKEGQNASYGLAMVGEFDAVVPASSDRAGQYRSRGAPAGFHCPSPVPITISQLVIMKKSPSPNAAKLITNWFLSKEGQIAQFFASGQLPVHKDLQNPEFMQYPETMFGKPIAFRSPEMMLTIQPKVMRLWTDLWMTGTGTKIVKVSTVLDRVRRSGRKLYFKAGKESHEVRVSGRRSKVVIDGTQTGRSSLKAGMKCTITYGGNKGVVQDIDCKR